ncbi:MAG TPA: GlsB/YeaQ/YmgE family stress response membrane protein [Tepidisphaeraceae bacterium]|jgi:uncharacterized membrane protein YeaQ/YmgE (transglycosylase-associated protein family)|nr:GlsB/YeaQ/YmgE family stress response membrane protein [Tepidisphaeraceae bacterium]
MRLIIWVLVGLLSGFLASKILYNRGAGPLIDLLLGLVGGFVGGFLFDLLGFKGRGVIYHIVVATVGAIIVLVLYHNLMR